eukprot:gnl/MRDRNA2_/MRDRNA2_175141_c0_seq1.p1 gnl/MRDRNA2_/MRDRNA2_175141_c0~~gnl/MRDRNA2_/MRDRNA2_175141_c0_seq1.p1  ORF type:complete len:249 (-),score=34.62 gnl/MRDRNA2_/MRDRNA2_175141_c0_seq1:95-751(-)
MTLKNSPFVVMDLPHLDPTVVGILGYNFFNSVMLDIENSRSGARAFIYDPEDPIVAEVDARGPYTPLRIMSQIAFVEAKVQADCDEPPASVLMLLDTGAGQSDMMFNDIKALESGLIAMDGSNLVDGLQSLRGVGGDEVKGIDALVKYVEIGGARLRRRGGLTACLTNSVIDNSNYANGILGMQLFQDCRILLDYPRKQVRVLPNKQKQAKPSKSGFR